MPFNGGASLKSTPWTFNSRTSLNKVDKYRFYIVSIYLIALGSLTNSSILISWFISNSGAAWCILSLS